MTPNIDTGRIDVHSHLLPGVDDGCRTLEESIQCARELAAAGYTHSFCTPHIWPNLPENNVSMIPVHTQQLQDQLDLFNVRLQLMPGGEINLNPETMHTEVDELVSYGMQRKFVLIDLWAQTLPSFFVPAIQWLQSTGAKVILAHPERMRAVQDDPDLADIFADLGILLQGNLQCLADPPGSATRRVADRYLSEGRYFLLGSDLHNLNSLPIRLRGLHSAIKAVGDEAVNTLTIDNPRKLFA